jgi:threonine dehydratase
MSASGITLSDILSAQRTLRHLLPVSPVRESTWLSQKTGGRVLLKLESVQPTNAFKIRGAFNAVARVAKLGVTVVTASAGNHGRAIALAGERFGVRTVVFTPKSAPAAKKQAIVHHGAELHDDFEDYDAAERAARDYASREGATFISPYNHRDVIAAAGTIGVEIVDQVPDTNVVVVPIGGGGLASGVGVAVKQAAPRTRVIGVEVDASRPFATGLERGAITPIQVNPSLADGLIGNLEPGSITFDYVRRYVDRLVSVSEEALRNAARGLIEEEHLVAEGAGAAATAAVLSCHVIDPGECAVVLVTGANIDLARLREVIG